jgi:hypothetical protein
MTIVQGEQLTMEFDGIKQPTETQALLVDYDADITETHRSNAAFGYDLSKHDRLDSVTYIAEIPTIGEDWIIKILMWKQKREAANTATTTHHLR